MLKGQQVQINKEGDEHNKTIGKITDEFVHTPSNRIIYTVEVQKKGFQETRYFNEKYVKAV